MTVLQSIMASTLALENLPINLRTCVTDEEKMRNWKAPLAEVIQ